MADMIGAIVAAQEHVRMAAQHLRAAIDGQTEEERVLLQYWALELTAVEAEMERFLSS